MTTIEHNLTIPRNGLTRLLDQHQRLAAFLLTALVFMILHKIKGVAEFPWDAGGYWKLSAWVIDGRKSTKTLQGL